MLACKLTVYTAPPTSSVSAPNASGVLLPVSVFLGPQGQLKLGQPSRDPELRAVVQCFRVPYTCGTSGSEMFVRPLQNHATLKVMS